MRKVTQLIPIICFALSLGACGGGGGGGGTPVASDPLDTIPYTGATAPAAIADNNAEALAMEAYLGGSAAGAAIVVAAPESASLSPAAVRSAGPRLVSLSRGVASAVTRLARGPAAPGANVARLTPYSETIAGTYGGNAFLNMDLNESTGAFSGTFTYVDFNDDGYTTLNGVVGFSGRINFVTLLYDDFYMELRLLQATTPDGASTLSGRISLRQTATTETMTVSMRERDETSGLVYWVDQYTYTTTVGIGYADLTVSGRFYDPVHGCVSLSTAATIRANTGDAYPSQGVLLLQGGNGAQIRLTFLSPTTYRVEADKNGDGFFEFDTGPKAWPG